MHYVITGGCGFIGSHLADRLLANGHAVTAIDDLSSGRRENLASGATLLVRDVTAPGAFDDVVAQADGCFHLAAIASVQQSIEDPKRTHAVNFGGTEALFAALAHQKRTIPVVFASSAAVYGNCPEVPLKESARTAPLSAYGTDKLACEKLAKASAGTHGIPSACLRFFNVYGPRQDPASPYSGVISIFASRMKRRLPVTIYGDGEQLRDFIYVGDVVDAMAAAMRKLEGKQLDCGVFNVCTAAPTSINRLAQAVATLTGSHAATTHAPARQGDIRLSVGDAGLCRQTLGFAAAVTLANGLSKTLESL